MIQNFRFFIKYIVYYFSLLQLRSGLGLHYTLDPSLIAHTHTHTLYCVYLKFYIMYYHTLCYISRSCLSFNCAGFLNCFINHAYKRNLFQVKEKRNVIKFMIKSINNLNAEVSNWMRIFYKQLNA